MIDTPINVIPTKELFIYMLTRDVKLEKAIIDLIDNSVDAALHNAKDKADLSHFKIDIILHKDSFSIFDNCGGIPLDAAINYAFKFGRPSLINAEKDAEENIGQFGIGMKRTMFKLGQKCEIESLSPNSMIMLDLDVNEWLQDDKDWKFNLEVDKFKDQIDFKDTYTKITITELYSNVSSFLNVHNNIINLKNEIEESHAYSLKRKLKITINDTPLVSRIPTLKMTEKIKPITKQFLYDEGKPSEVKIKIYAGVHERELSEAGWYIFCNDRQVVEANRTELTGWGLNSMRRFTNDLAFFRGYVFFESKHGDSLPWTTTKDGVNFDSFVYQRALFEMKEIIKPILAFLTDLAKETTEFNKEPDNTERILNEAIEELEKSDSLDVQCLDIDQTFVAPVLNLDKSIKTASICYSMPLDDVNEMKKFLKASSNREIGIKTFEYFQENEMGL